MKTVKWLSGAAFAALGLVASAPASWAAAGDECVKILGYEWSGEKKARIPFRFHRPDGKLLLFAGLSESWQPAPEAVTARNMKYYAACVPASRIGSFLRILMVIRY